MREIKFRAWITNKSWDYDAKKRVEKPFMLYNPPFLVVGKYSKTYRVATLDCCTQKMCRGKEGCEHLMYSDYGYLDGGLYPTDAVLMQYTGLKDKNGVEIYEGDILKIKFDVGKVEGWLWITLSNKEKETGERLVLIKSLEDIYTTPLPDDFEVVGNIHENLELLEDVK